MPWIVDDLTPVEPALGQRFDDSPYLWFDARDLQIEGKGWRETDRPYDRLPSRAEGRVPQAVWDLSRMPSGFAVRLVTDSPVIAAQWDGGEGFQVMPATGTAGLDLYRREYGQWMFRGIGLPDAGWTEAVLAPDLPEEPGEYLVFLPLYVDLHRLLIGIDPDARLYHPPRRPPEHLPPLVFYGTSITQGMAASRTGMVYPSIVSRWMNREAVNLGFSGSGKMEMALAELLAELDAGIYVIDCVPNMSEEEIRERVVPFVRHLLRQRPGVPVLLVTTYFIPQDSGPNRAMIEAYQQLRAEGAEGVYLLPGTQLMSSEENGTVDRVHPTDLGAVSIARAMRAAIENILRERLNRPRE